MTILGEVDRLCEKNSEMDELVKIYGLKKWRYVEYPINRLTLLLEKLMRFQECLEQIEKYEQIDDRVGLTKKDKESLDKRKAQIIKNFHNKILHTNRYRRKWDIIPNGSSSKGVSYDRRGKIGDGIILVDFDRRQNNAPYYSGPEKRSGMDRSCLLYTSPSPRD